MAKTEQGRELTENHRIAQVKLAERLTTWVIGVVLKAFDIRDIDASSLEISRILLPIVLQMRYISEDLSKDYTKKFRNAEVPKSQWKPFDFGFDDLEPVEAEWQIIVTVRATAKIAVKQANTSTEVAEKTAKAVAAKTQKIAQDGGRRAILHDVEFGKGPIGYARVPDANPCAFCAMLASRGVSYTKFLPDGVGLYRSDSFVASNARFIGDGKFKVHDWCGCTIEAVYDHNGKITLPGNGDELAWQWAEIAAGQKDPFAAWRRWWDSKTLPDDYEGPLETQGTVRGTRKKKQPRKHVPIAGLTREDYAKRADNLQSRLIRLDEEIAAMQATGATSRDVNLASLLHQRKAFLSRITSYKKLAATM